MGLITFIMHNWDSALVIATVAALLVFVIVKKQWGLLEKVLFALVTWAEREYGGGTGSLKLAAVIEKLYPHIPAIIRLFIMAAELERAVDKALAQAKKRWDKNPSLLAQ